jgi:UDP-N-acetylmuramyl pentapeptide phosphotransferase/UDP-N-acetylglucosamine-1-phosphate transferase
MIAALAAFLASAIGVALFRRVAIARGWVAQANERSSHQGAIPLGAGIVVLIVSLVGAWPIGALGWGYLMGAVLLASVSWLDDLYSVPIAGRLVVQILAAVALLSGARLSGLAWPLLVVWVVALVNIYNFMDGIDGMAGLQAVVAGVAWYLLGSRFAMSGVAHFGVMLAAASAGFLVHNVSKNRVFLGDVGSVFLGYSFAALTVTASVANPGGPLFITGALFLWPLLFDTSVTLLRRWRRGAPLTQAHREHLYQRLVQGGISHAGVSLTYAGLSVLGAGAGALLLYRSPVFDLVTVFSISSLALLLWRWVRHVEKRVQSKTAVGP